MCDVALGDAQALGEQRRDKVAVRVIADHQVRPAAELGERGGLDIRGKALQVGPDLEARAPLPHDGAVSFMEWHAQYPGVVAADHFFQPLVGGGVARFRDQPRHDQHLG